VATLLSLLLLSNEQLEHLGGFADIMRLNIGGGSQSALNNIVGGRLAGQEEAVVISHVNHDGRERLVAWIQP
jgi:hypothetical protein